MPAISGGPDRKYRKRLPSGRNDGHVWNNSPLDTSTCVRAVAVPPVSETRHSGPPDPPPQLPKTITPSWFQLPDPATLPAAVQIVSGGPPAVSILRSSLPKPNAMYRLSGDQNGWAAPSVPVRRLHSSWSKS